MNIQHTNIAPLGTVFTFSIGEPATAQAIAEALQKFHVTGATIIQTVGLWDGETEESHDVKIAGISEFQAQNLAEDLRNEFDQDAVYLEFQGNAMLVQREAHEGAM